MDKERTIDPETGEIKEKKTKKKEAEMEITEIKSEKSPEEKFKEYIKNLNPRFRFAHLKAEVRTVELLKEEEGYKGQYFYVSLKDMQQVFTKLELKYLLTSIYNEETRHYGEGIFKNFAKRKLVDLITGEEIAETEIDITNLKQLSDNYLIGKDVLRISEPRDAWKTLFLDFFEPQNLGAISTYFQRYTYNQLYDFQETKADKIEQKGKLEGKLKVEKEEVKTKKVEKEEKKTPKEERLSDVASKIRTEIKKTYLRDEIIKQLDGRKLSIMTEKEALKFLEEMKENYKTKGEE